jgi:hypothetical protein
VYLAEFGEIPPEAWAWLRRFVEIEGNLNLWRLIDSQFFTTVVVGLATIYFAHIARAIKDDVADEETISGLRSEVEAEEQEPVVPLGNGAIDHFPAAADIVDRLKTYVDELIEEIPDGRKRRKYPAIGKRDYRIRVAALHEDGGLTEQEYGRLARAFEIWRPYQTHRRPTPNGVLLELRSLSNGIPNR